MLKQISFNKLILVHDNLIKHTRLNHLLDFAHIPLLTLNASKAHTNSTLTINTNNRWLSNHGSIHSPTFVQKLDFTQLPLLVLCVSKGNWVKSNKWFNLVWFMSLSCTWVSLLKQVCFSFVAFALGFFSRISCYYNQFTLLSHQ